MERSPDMATRDRKMGSVRTPSSIPQPPTHNTVTFYRKGESARDLNDDCVLNRQNSEDKCFSPQYFKVFFMNTI